MITKQVEVNGTIFHLTLTDQVIGQVNNLKDLYSTAYEDPESFDQVSSEISSTINQIASAVEPHASDSDLDGLIQEIIQVVDEKANEIKKVLEGKPTKKSSKSTRKRLKSKK